MAERRCGIDRRIKYTDADLDRLQARGYITEEQRDDARAILEMHDRRQHVQIRTLRKPSDLDKLCDDLWHEHKAPGRKR